MCIRDRLSVLASRSQLCAVLRLNFLAYRSLRLVNATPLLARVWFDLHSSPPADARRLPVWCFIWWRYAWFVHSIILACNLNFLGFIWYFDLYTLTELDHDSCMVLVDTENSYSCMVLGQNMSHHLISTNCLAKLPNQNYPTKFWVRISYNLVWILRVSRFNSLALSWNLWFLGLNSFIVDI